MLYQRGRTRKPLEGNWNQSNNREPTGYYAMFQFHNGYKKPSVKMASAIFQTKKRLSFFGKKTEWHIKQCSVAQNPQKDEY